jgi:hypothetical protein
LPLCFETEGRYISFTYGDSTFNGTEEIMKMCNYGKPELGQMHFAVFFFVIWHVLFSLKETLSFIATFSV